MSILEVVLVRYRLVVSRLARSNLMLASSSYFGCRIRYTVYCRLERVCVLVVLHTTYCICQCHGVVLLQTQLRSGFLNVGRASFSGRLVTTWNMSHVIDPMTKKICIMKDVMTPLSSNQTYQHNIENHRLRLGQPKDEWYHRQIGCILFCLGIYVHCSKEMEEKQGQQARAR